MFPKSSWNFEIRFLKLCKKILEDVLLAVLDFFDFFEVMHYKVIVKSAVLFNHLEYSE